jgi:hypothetical protein
MDDDDDNCGEFLTSDNLVRCVTVDSYFAADLAHHKSRRTPEVFQAMEQRIQTVKDGLNNRALPGDEWWEWIQGPERLMQTGGIALVRAGTVIYARQCWIS